MSAARKRTAVSANHLNNGSVDRQASSSTAKGVEGGQVVQPNGKVEGKRRQNGLSEADVREVDQLRVGVLPLVDKARNASDDGRAVVWLDIDNTLYSKGTEIHKLMTQRIRAYIIGLGLGEEEAERLHQKYYTEYGLAIRGLVMHQQIDALDYDSKCDATLPLETVLAPNPEHKALLQSLDRSKCRVWALTNAYKTHAVRVLKLLELYDFIEGIIYCDYAQAGFACKPEREFYDAALKVVGLKDASRCYFVDDSMLNITAARKLGWGHCVLFNEPLQEAKKESPNGKQESITPFDANVFVPSRSPSQTFDKDRIQIEFRKLTQQQRVELLHIILEACLPGDVIRMQQILDKELRLTRDMFGNLPDDIAVRIFEKLEVKELLTCQMVCKRWKAIAANPLLWKSHALALTEGDPVGLIAPDDPSGWEPLVRGLYFRERNWSKGICQNLTLMHGHTGFVTAMKLKGRKTLVTGSYDETIRVWDLYSGECKKVLTAKAIACLDFLSEEGVLAAGLYDTGRIMVWDMKTWSLLQTLSGHNRGIRHVAITPDYLVSVGQDKSIVVWDWQKGTKLVRFGQQSNVSLGVSIVDHDKIVAVTVDGIIRTFSIRKKEMIGQFDLAKLSSSLSSQLHGLKGGTLMLQWFAAHRNTLTLASQNLVVHLQWQEHVVPVQHVEEHDSSHFRLRPRSDSSASNTSTASNMTSRSSAPRLSTTRSNATTPIKATRGSLTPSHSSSGNVNRLMTPSRFNSMSSRSSLGNCSPSSAAPWPTSPAANGRVRGTPSPAPPLTPTKQASDGKHQAPTSIPSSPTSSSAPSPAVSPAQTRIAPNLGIAPLIVDILQTPDAAVGCVDPAKKRIVLATRFSSRAGADRRIYSSTLDCSAPSGGCNKSDVEAVAQADSDRDVVPIGGAWQAKADELATPLLNPMSLVLDHENCVVGTSEGLVYRMGFVGSGYKHGWQQTHDATEVDDGSAGNHADVKGDVVTNEDGSKTITDLLQLRTVWKHLFVE